MDDMMERDTEGMSGSGITVPPLPGWNLVGLGYDVFGKYADKESAKLQIFEWSDEDFEPVNYIKEGAYIPKRMTATTDSISQYHLFSKNTLEAYQTEQSKRVSLGVGYSFFGGSLTSDFTESCRSSVKVWFTKYTHLIGLWDLKLKPGYKELREKLVEQVKTDLDDIFNATTNEVKKDKAVRFFAKYGTHYISGLTVGGRINYTATTSESEFKTESEVKRAAELSFKSDILKIGIDSQSDEKKQIERFRAHSETFCSTIGGSVSLGGKINALDHSKEDYDKWVKSVEDSPKNAMMVDFDSNSLTPFSTLCQNEVQTRNLDDFFVEYAAEIARQFGVDGYYIDKLQVITGKNKDQIEVPTGYTRIDYDLNKGAGGDYIYICIHKEACPKTFEIDSSKPPKPGILDIKVIGWPKNTPKGQETPIPDGFIKDDVDLNKGADGDFIYLCYKHGPYDADRMIKNIAIVGGDNEFVKPPYEYQMDPYDLNKGAGGEYIYLCFKR